MLPLVLRPVLRPVKVLLMLLVVLLVVPQAGPPVRLQVKPRVRAHLLCRQLYPARALAGVLQVSLRPAHHLDHHLCPVLLLV